MFGLYLTLIACENSVMILKNKRKVNYNLRPQWKLHNYKKQMQSKLQGKSIDFG